ncbi:retrotransposon protein, putative, ty1-copia subclass [Tanacetum coccineum]
MSLDEEFCELVNLANGKGKDKQVYIPKPKNPKPSAKEHPAKDDTCHHCKEVGHCKRNCPAYLCELIKEEGSSCTASSSDVFIIELFSFPTKSWVYDTSCGTHICNTKHGLGGCSKIEVENQLGKTIKALQSDRGGEYISQEFKDYLKACGIVQQLTLLYTPQHNGESATRILNMVPTKKVDKTPYELWYGKVLNLSYLKWLEVSEFFEKNLITQEVSGRAIDLKEIQDEDTSPSEITSEIPMEVEGFEPPQEEEIPIRRSERTRRAPNRLCLNWIDAMNAEIQSMMDNMVWVLVDLPPGCKTVRKKYARSIYGLKQASRSWNKRFDEEIKRFGFAQNLDEPCVYQKASGSNVTFLILYVDDIIIMGNHIPSLQSVKDYLGKCFAMKDLGEAAFILGIKIYRDRSKRLIRLGQNAYMDKILKRYRMDNSKRGHIPMQERLDLNKTQGASTPEEVKRMQNVPYASAVGSIMYAVRCTRPDVAFANTKDMFLVYGGNPEAELRVDCYCNAGFEDHLMI